MADLSKPKEYGDLKQRTDMLGAVPLGPRQSAIAPATIAGNSEGDEQLLDMPDEEIIDQQPLTAEQQTRMWVDSFWAGLAETGNITPEIEGILEDLVEHRKGAYAENRGNAEPGNTDNGLSATTTEDKTAGKTGVSGADQEPAQSQAQAQSDSGQAGT